MIAGRPRPRIVARVAFSLAALALAAAAPLHAADDREEQSAAIAALEQATGGKVEVTRSSRTGLVTFLSIRNAAAQGEGLVAKDAEASARAFVNSYGRLFGLRDASQLRLTRTSARDAVGMDHLRFQQLEQGVPVTGAELIVHLKGSQVTAMNGKALRIPGAFDVAPTLGAERARAAAATYMRKHFKIGDATLSEPRLEVFDRALIGGGPRPTRLAWFVEASRIDARRFFWIDAHNGAILQQFSQLPHALNRKIYTANNNATLPGTSIRNEGGAATGDIDADRAYDYSGDTYDYYFTKHGRDSFDGAGAQLKSTVHYCPSQDECPYENAFWNGAQMVYGEGFSAADDVAAHELTHAVTERSAGLFYYMQSGALNESFSDIFGETVDQTNGAGTDTPAVKWKMGEDVPVFGALRDMMDPTLFGNPGKVSDPEYVCEVFPWYGDSGGVHYNSGVPNHAYALMVDGGTYNGHTVTGMGLDKAGAIQYRALTQYLSTASDFRDDYDALLNSCYDLVGGTLGITDNNCTEVQDALDAVEMTDDQPCTPPQAAVPDQCPVGTGPVFAFADNLENTRSGNWSTSVIEGANMWTGGAGTPPIYFSDYARGGTFSFWGFDTDFINDSTVNMAKSVLVPANGRLYFNHSYGFERQNAINFDGGVLDYSTDAGAHWNPVPDGWFSAGAAYGGTLAGADNPLNGRTAFVGESLGYTASRLDISALAGQNARFRFRIGSDDGNADYGWFIDDVRIYSCDVGGTVKLSAPTYSVSESGGNLLFTVTRSGGAAGDVSVDYTTSDGSAGGSDYVPRSGTIFFPSGSSGAAISQTINIPIVNDTIAEGSETFTITLSNPSGASLALGAPSSATATITDNDVAGALSFSAAAFGVNESSASATITVKRTGGSASGVSATVGVQAGGSATAAADYTFTNALVTFGAGQMTATVQVPIVNDTIDEANETVNLLLSAPGGNATLGAPGAAVLTIADNDTAGALQFSSATYSVSEGAGAAVITVARSGGTASGVSVHYATADGTAGGDDYTSSSGTLNFGAGQTTGTFVVPINPDSLGENNETVLLALSAPTGSATLGTKSTAVLTIVEDETVMQFSAPQFAVSESGTKVTMTVKRSGNVAGTSSVHYSLVDGSAVGGADYTPISGNLNFAAKSTSQTFTVAILNDTASENPEFFVGHLSAPTGGTLGPLGSATVLINDDDAVLALSAAAYSGAEGGSGVTITVKRTGNKATLATVDYDTSSGSATEPGDSGGAHGTLTFNPNVTQLTFKVPIVDDADPETTETLNLELSNATGALLGLHSAVVSITDNDPRLAFSAATYSGSEASASAAILVKRSGPTGGTVTVHFATSNGTATAGADYAPTSGTLTFNPGVTQLSFPVTILPDPVGEAPETVNLTLSAPTGASLGIDAAVLTIADNDASIGFSATRFSVKESGKNATITVKRTGPTTAPASVHYAVNPGGTATAGTDFTEPSGTLTLPAGKSSATFTVPITNDLEDEPAETVLLVLSSPTGGVLGLKDATLTIEDDDAATTAKLSASSYSASEATGVAQLTVLRSGVAGLSFTVHYFTADGSAQAGTDYLGTTGFVTFAAGEMLKVIEIPLFENNAGSPAKTFTVTLENLTNGATLAAPGAATVFITE